MTSRSCRAGARATPRMSTSAGSSGPTCSNCRSSPRRWTASSRRRTATQIGKLGGLAVLNLEGIWTRYADADKQLEKIAKASPGDATKLMQQLYTEPVKPELVAQRVQEIKAAGVLAAASLTPQRVREYHAVALEAGPRHPRHPGHGRLGRARLLGGRAAQPQGVHREPADPDDRRRLRELPDRAAPHAHGRGGRARRRRARRGLHDARRARRGRARRRRRSPTRRPPASSTCSRPGSTATSSPTAACAPAATSPRPSPAAPTP